MAIVDLAAVGAPTRFHALSVRNDPFALAGGESANVGLIGPALERDIKEPLAIGRNTGLTFLEFGLHQRHGAMIGSEGQLQNVGSGFLAKRGQHQFLTILGPIRRHGGLIRLVYHLRLSSADGLNPNPAWISVYSGSNACSCWGSCIGDLRSIGRPDRSSVASSVKGEPRGDVAFEIQNPNITVEHPCQA